MRNLLLVTKAVLLFAALILLKPQQGMGQSPCFSVSLPSTNAGCPGTPFTINPTLSGSATSLSYTWSGTGLSFSNTHTLSTTVTTPSVATNCTLTVTGNCELITNGDFEAGHTGFGSDYSYSCGGGGGTIQIVSTSNACGHTCGAFYDRTGTSSGKMLIVDGANNPTEIVWKQSVYLVAGTTYYFSAWVRPISDNTPGGGETRTPRLAFRDGGTYVTGHTFVVGCNGWDHITATITATSTGSRVFSLEDTRYNPSGQGNDFVIDDISLIGPSTVQYVTSIVPKPVPVFTPNVQYVPAPCIGNQINLLWTNPTTGGAAPAPCSGCTYSWSYPYGGSSTLANPIINPTTSLSSGVYTLTVTNSYGCSDSETVNVTLYNQPNAGIILGPDEVCQGGTITLTNPTATYSYSAPWESDDVTIATINPVTGVVTGLNPGTVTISYSVGNPCNSLVIATKTITVHPIPDAHIMRPACTPLCPGSCITFTISGIAGTNVVYHQLPYIGAAVTYMDMFPGTPGTPSTLTVTFCPPVGFSSITLYLDHVSDPVTGCGQDLTEQMEVLIDWPTATIIPPQVAKCAGECVDFTVIGPPNGAVVVKPVGGGTAIYVYLDMFGFGSFTTPDPCPTGPVSYQIVEIWGCCVYPWTGPAVTYTPIPYPNISLTAVPNPACEGDLVTLIGTDDLSTGNYTFAGPALGYTSIASSDLTYEIRGVTLADAGTYYFTASNEICTSTATVDLKINPAPTLKFIGDGKICEGQNNDVYLTFSGCDNCDVTYKGVDAFGTVTTYPTLHIPAGGVTFAVSPTLTSSTTFTVVDVVSPLGCHNITSVPPVTISMVNHPTTACDVTCIQDEYTYLWTCEISGTPGATITGILNYIDGTLGSCPYSGTFPYTGTPSVYPSPADCGASSTASIISLQVHSIAIEGCIWQDSCEGGISRPANNGNVITSNNNTASLSIIPNPSNGNFSIEQSLDKDASLSVKITDAVGRVVYDKPTLFEEGISKMDASNFPSGLYLVEVTDTKGQRLVTKLVIEK